MDFGRIRGSSLNQSQHASGFNIKRLNCTLSPRTLDFEFGTSANQQSFKPYGLGIATMPKCEMPIDDLY